MNQEKFVGNSMEEGIKASQTKLGVSVEKLQWSPELKWEMVTPNHIK